MIDDKDKKEVEIFKISQVFNRFVTAIFSQKSIKTKKNENLRKHVSDRKYFDRKFRCKINGVFSSSSFPSFIRVFR
jgi:hypothetical protein